jgi:voltage-gated sodium channel
MLVERLRRIVEAKPFQYFIIAVIVANTIVLGLETDQGLMREYGSVFTTLNVWFVAIYVVEIVMKLVVYRGKFFADGWNIFDFLIVVISVIPTAGVFSGLRILRVFRVLRALRLISGVKQLRKIVSSILRSLPGIGWTVLLMILIYYIFAIVGIHLFGHDFPDIFGSLSIGFSTLFELTTLEGWQDIVMPVTVRYQWGWVYFLFFMVLASFILLNVILGIVVDSLALQEEDAECEAEENVRTGTADISDRITTLRAQLDDLETAIKAQR